MSGKMEKVGETIIIVIFVPLNQQ